jgi:WD40 repeat protein/ABC-type Fe3+/spermidine/putrescine transport system ATPase subunit
MARYALVVGIAEYDSRHLNNLSKPVGDAEAMAALLEQHGQCERVTVLKGRVTTSALSAALKTLLMEQAAKSEAIAYFIGHGFTVTDAFGNAQGYLATSDCDLVVENGQPVEQSKALAFSSLNKLIQTADLSNLVLLLDTCHSGDFIERTVVEQSFTAFGAKPDYFLLTACRGHEQSWAKRSEAHSVFTGAVLAGLMPEKADEAGYITGDRLFDHLQQALRGSRQEPRRYGQGRSLPIVRFQTLAPLPTVSEVCPYQGLEAFTPETRQFFYGREAVVARLRQMLAQVNFVPVIGPSGSGKSSVVRAGLVPSLGAGWQVLEPIKPDIEPMAALRRAISSLFQRATDKQRVSAYLNDQAMEPLLALLSSTVQTDRLLLVIDQFEEVFTVCPVEAERAQFIGCITAVQTVADSPLAIVTTMRADFVEPWLDYGDLVQTIQDQAVWLGRLQGDDLVRAIEEPAKRQGYQLAPGLLDLILEDVQSEKHCLPLLEFALTALWEQRDTENRVLPLAVYREMQRLRGALNQRAEAVYLEDLKTAAERDWARRICLELVRIGPEVKDTRQRQPRQQLLELGKTAAERETIGEVIEALVRGRLLVADQPSPSTPAPTPQTSLAEGGYIDLAHEALMAGWARFAQWRQQGRDLRRLVQRVRDAEQEWLSKGQDERYLMQGGLLAEVRERWPTVKGDLIGSTQQFYQRSDDQEREQVAFLERALAEAELREQALKMINLMPMRPYEATAQGIGNVGDSHQRLKEVMTPTYSGLKKIFNTVRESGCFQGHEAQVTSVTFSPDGQTILSGSADCTVRLWGLQGNPIGDPFKGHEDWVRSVTFSPDGQIILSGSDDRTLRLWDLRGNSIGDPFQGHRGSISSVTFSPDGRTILSGSGDCTLRLWDLQGNSIGDPFQGHRGSISSVTFSPDGRTILSGSSDCTLRLWDLQGNSIGNPFQGHRGSISSVTFSPDGQTILSCSTDCTLRLWDLRGNSIGDPFQGHEGSVWSAAFSPDGQTILSGSSDRTPRLWDLRGNSIGDPFQGHEDQIWSVAFSPDGQTILSGSADRSLRLWDLQGNSIGDPFQGHEDQIWSVAFSPDGQTILSGSADHSLRLWDLQGNSIGDPFQEHGGSVWSVAFSPDGQTILSGSDDGAVRLWELNGNPIGAPFKGHEDSVWSVAFSPGGHTILSGSADCTVRLWDLDGNPIGDPFKGHEDWVRSVTFSPDGQTIVSGSSDHTLRLWDLDGNPIGDPFKGHEESVRSVAFSPNGQIILSGSDDRTLRLWNLRGNPIGDPFRGHKDWVRSVAFSPDGQTILSGSADCTLRLWDLDGNPIGDPLRSHRDSVWSVAFSSDGQTIVSGSADRTVRLWRGGTWRDWLALCCNRFRYHPLFKHADREPFISACKVCEEYVWSKEEMGS